MSQIQDSMISVENDMFQYPKRDDPRLLQKYIELSLANQQLFINHSKLTKNQKVYRKLSAAFQQMMVLLKQNGVNETQLKQLIENTITNLNINQSEEIISHGRQVFKILSGLNFKNKSNESENKTKKSQKKEEKRKKQVEKTEIKKQVSKKQFQHYKTQQKQQLVKQSQPKTQQQKQQSATVTKKKEENTKQNQVQKTHPKNFQSFQRLLQREQFSLDFNMPITWEDEHPYFKLQDTRVTKINSNIYLKIASKYPLPSQGIHTIKIKKLCSGTTAFGIVPEPYKSHKSIHDQKVPTVKYISFSNGGGKIVVNGRQSNKSNTHLIKNDILTIKFDANKKTLKFSNNKAGDFPPIQLKQRLDERLYFYMEMKTQGTAVQIL